MDIYEQSYVLERLEQEQQEDQEFAGIGFFIIFGYIISLAILLVQLLYKAVAGLYFFLAPNLRTAVDPVKLRITPDYLPAPEQPGYVKTRCGIYLPGDYNVR